MTQPRTVPPTEITDQLVSAGAVLLDEPEYRRCPVANAYHRISMVFDKPGLPANIRRGMKDTLYRAIFTLWPEADIHDCQLQVWEEPCVTYTPARQRCGRGNPFRPSEREEHAHVYARVTYSEDSLPRLDRLYSQTVRVAA